MVIGAEQLRANVQQPDDAAESGHAEVRLDHRLGARLAKRLGHASRGGSFGAAPVRPLEESAAGAGEAERVGGVARLGSELDVPSTSNLPRAGGARHR
jgi:hypothetical protein